MKALRTLVVEDDAMIGGLLAETLEGLGHAVCAVETNVAKAVAAASHWSPDLMIVDVGLGEASGIAAVKEILRSGFVPHVFVTGDALSGVSLGPDTVLMRKPFRVSDLDHAIQRALADLRNLGDALAFALRFHGCKRVHNADEIMSEMVSNGFVVVKWPSSGGRAALARRFEG